MKIVCLYVAVGRSDYNIASAYVLYAGKLQFFCSHIVLNFKTSSNSFNFVKYRVHKKSMSFWRKHFSTLYFDVVVFSPHKAGRGKHCILQKKGNGEENTDWNRRLLLQKFGKLGINPVLQKFSLTKSGVYEYLWLIFISVYIGSSKLWETY